MDVSGHIRLDEPMDLFRHWRLLTPAAFDGEAADRCVLIGEEELGDVVDEVRVANTEFGELENEITYVT